MSDIRNHDTHNGSPIATAYVDPHKTNAGRNSAINQLKADNAAKDAVRDASSDLPVDVQKWISKGRPVVTKKDNGDVYYIDGLGCFITFPSFMAHHFKGYIA